VTGLLLVGIGWLIPNPTGEDLALMALVLGAVGVAGWRLVTIVGDVMVRDEESHRVLFRSSPVAILEEDFSEVGARLEVLRTNGVSDLSTYLLDHEDETRSLISSIRIRRANPAAIRMIGASSLEELVGAFESADRDDLELDAFVQQFVAIWEGRSQGALDLTGFDLAGAPIEAVLHWSVSRRGEGPDLSHVVVTISDITPRKAIEEELAEAADSIRRLLEFEHALTTCSRALLMGSGDDALQEALETLRVAMGADRAHLAVNLDDPDLGQSFRVVNSASGPGNADDWLGQVIPWSVLPHAPDLLANGRPFQELAGEVPEHQLDRSLLAVPVFNEGEWVGTVGFVDVDRTTRWSEDAIRMLEVAAPMLGTFWERDITRRRLEELVRSKDRFVASVSHELRTPLAAILGFAEEIRDNASSFRAEELSDMLELVADQSQEMADMIEDLLVSARADIGAVTIRAQDVYLRGQAEAVIAGLGASARHVEMAGGPGKAWADPTRTRQILRNLITNALRYGGKEVCVEISSKEDRAELTVRDNGTGLPAAEWERIFEPYQRAHDRPTQPSSIGLGLTVARQLARLMGGELDYRSDRSGSRFTLTLPARPEEPTEPAYADQQPEDALMPTV
jgi:two-component system sensor histidine kinase KdpD